jgi:hypothetical protein
MNMDIIETTYHNLVDTPSDINEHLPVLKQYAEKCDTVTEMGVRYVVSTFALVLAKPKKLISIDLFHPSFYGDTSRLYAIQNYAKNNGVDYKFVMGNTLNNDIEQTDMLFIDTLHVYGQLKKELEKHASNVNKYIVFHDTTTFEYQDEKHYYNVDALDTSKTGLWPAIQEFLDSHTEWEILERRTNNNGLTILQKKTCVSS